MTDLVDMLTSYTDAGLGVLPLHSLREDGSCSCGKPDCHSPAKHPITHHGKDDATTDVGQIAEWLAAYPGCNWGIRPALGVVVLDVDVRSDGPATLDALQARHGALPPTLTARTGSGGLHLWFSYSGPTRGKLGQGIDVKTHSGYLVAPPSVHACGGTYEWTDMRPAAYAPQWVKDILNPPVRRYVNRGNNSNIDGLVKFVTTATEGERNARLYWAACRAHEAGIDPEPLVDAAVAVGLTHLAALATVRSAGNATPRARAPRPTPAEFMRDGARKAR